ncbi:hypothetical protein B296_00005331 [Ensete ventricosum]|uniref:mRNA cap-binding protein n=1 Tax=Ensete ventricosum TaxID=4639 RepID=A0A427AZU9_ENSVE|nr:hypothetical protein B296_00005331 [Ensete ventricosum]
MESAEEAETKGSASPPPSATTASAAVEVEGDMEERERYSREIKAGLHPLKVPLRSHLSICGPSLSRCRLQSNMSNVSSSGLFSIGMILALVGDQLDYGDDVCGAVLSIRFNEDILSVWNRNASDHKVLYLHQIDLINVKSYFSSYHTFYITRR